MKASTTLRSLATLATASLLTVGLTACGEDTTTDGGGTADAGAGGGTTDTAADTADTAELDLVSDGELTVCSDVPYEPFEFEDEESAFGYSGFDMDLVGAIADGLGLDPVIRPSSFDGLQSGLALNSRQCDMVASAMTITEERAANLEFSEGYYDSLQSLLVAEGSDISSIDDLAGQRVGVQQGTTGATYAEENATDAEIVTFPSDAEMWQAVQAGQVVALLQDLPVNLEHTTSGDYTIAEEYQTDEQYGFAARQGNTDLIEAVNEQLQTLRDDGRYDEIYDRYFSEDAQDDAATTS